MILKEHQEKANQKLLDDPFPADPVGAILLKYFGHQWWHLRARPARRGKKPRWRLEKRYAIRKRNIWRDWQNENILIGLGFGNFCRRVMIDLDIGSAYHPDNNEELYHKLLGILEDLGLCKPVLVRSSFSGGCHLFHFFNEELPTYDVARTVRLALTAAGFKVKDGQLEIFPNTKPYIEKGKGYSNFKPHRLPLQPGTGSVLMNANTLEYKGWSLADFAGCAEWSAKGNDLEQFKKMMMLAKQENSDFWKMARKRRKVSEWREHLLDFIEEGWTGFHQTNILLLNIGIFFHVFLELTGAELVTAMVEKAINLPGYREYCRHQHEIEKRCRDWARSIERFYRRLYQNPKRKETYRKMFNRTSKETPNGNERKGSEASNRIKMAYDHLKELGQLPSKVQELVRALIKTAKELTGTGISRNTLFKQHNKELWHPKYQQQAPTSEVQEETQEETKDWRKKIVDCRLSLNLLLHLSMGKSTTYSLKSTNNRSIYNLPSTIYNPVTDYNPVTEATPTPVMQDAVQPSGQGDILQEELQAEPRQQASPSEVLTPGQVVCKKPEKSPEPELAPGERYEESSHTPSIMKGYPLPQGPADSLAAPQGLPGGKSPNENKDISGGNVTESQGSKGSKSASRDENEAKEAELASPAPLTDGGNVTEAQGSKSASRDENEAKEAELASPAPLTASDSQTVGNSQPESEEVLTLPKIKDKLNEFFSAAIAGFSMSEKWQLAKKRLELMGQARQTAQNQDYLKRLTRRGVMDESLEESEMRIRMRLFWESKIPALMAEVEKWCSFVDDWYQSLPSNS